MELLAGKETTRITIERVNHQLKMVHYELFEDLNDFLCCRSKFRTNITLDSLFVVPTDFD